MSRGSKLIVASIVSTTTAPNASAPVPGVTVATQLELHERDEYRDDEDVEHRPAADDFEQRGRAARGRRSARCTPRCTAIRIVSSASIFSSGTMMLATKTMIASGHEPVVHRKTTPLMIVSLCEPKSDSVSMIGSMFAGM